MKLSIIIVNYKTPELTLRCIESIYASVIDVSFEVIVVDNDSQDNSKEKITHSFPSVKWISNTYNAGFGRANNLGVKHAKGEFILLLNSDMLLLPDQNLNVLLNRIKDNSKIGVIGCKLLNEDGSFQKSYYYDIGTLKRELRNNVLWYKLMKPVPKRLDAVMGSFMLFRKTDFEKLEGFDEDFFMYAEELELCMRFKRKLQKEIIYDENYIAIHKHGGSSKVSDWSINQNMLSNALLHFKLNGWLGYFRYHAIFLINILTNTVFLFTLEKKLKESYLNTYKAYFNHFVSYFRIPFYYTFKKKRNFLKV